MNKANDSIGNDIPDIVPDESGTPGMEDTRNTEPATDAASAENQLMAELEAQKERYLRLAAEFENYKKRTVKEKESLFLEGRASAVAAILPVLDNLERACAFSGADPNDVTEGLKLIMKQMKESFEAIGVCEIAADGASFDPLLHNAVMHVEDETLGEGVVAEVLQKGYRMGERVIRHCVVKVAN